VFEVLFHVTVAANVAGAYELHVL